MLNTKLLAPSSRLRFLQDYHKLLFNSVLPRPKHLTTTSPTLQNTSPQILTVLPLQSQWLALPPPSVKQSETTPTRQDHCPEETDSEQQPLWDTAALRLAPHSQVPPKQAEGPAKTRASRGCESPFIPPPEERKLGTNPCPGDHSAFETAFVARPWRTMLALARGDTEVLWFYGMHDTRGVLGVACIWSMDPSCMRRLVSWLNHMAGVEFCFFIRLISSTFMVECLCLNS